MLPPWTWKEQQLRSSSTLLKTSCLEALLLDVIYYHTQDKRFFLIISWASINFIRNKINICRERFKKKKCHKGTTCTVAIAAVVYLGQESFFFRPVFNSEFSFLLAPQEICPAIQPIAGGRWTYNFSEGSWAKWKKTESCRN